jgi:hypothetical protein
MSESIIYPSNTALRPIGITDVEPSGQQSDLDCLSLIINQIALFILKLYNLLCCCHSWSDSHTARQIAENHETCTQPIPLDGHVQQLYNDQVARAMNTPSMQYVPQIGLPLIGEHPADPLNGQINPLLTRIPPEILVKEILPRCDSQSLLNLQQTCHGLENTITGESKLYKDMLIKLALKKALKMTEQEDTGQEDLCIKIYVLCSFAIIQAPINPEHANALLQDAVEYSNTLTGDSSHPQFNLQEQKSRALFRIAEAQKFMNLEEAIKTANQIPNTKFKEQILKDLAVEQSLTNLEAAFAIIYTISDKKLQGKTLECIAKQRALTDIDEARAIAEKIDQEDEDFDGRNMYNRVLYEIFKIQAKTNLPEVLTNIRMMEIDIDNDLENHHNFLWNLVNKLILTNPVEAKAVASMMDEDNHCYFMALLLAKTDLESALSQLNRIQDNYIKANAFRSLADEFIATNPAKANEFCQAALECLESNVQPSLGEDGFVRVYIIQTLLLINIDQAERTAKLIKDPYFRRMANYSIAKARASTHFEDTLNSPLFESPGFITPVPTNNQKYDYPIQMIYGTVENDYQEFDFPKLLKAGALAHPDRIHSYYLQAMNKAEKIWGNYPEYIQLIIELTEIYAEMVRP